MYRQHNFIAFFITTLSYLFAAILFWYIQQSFKITDNVTKEKPIKLNLSYFVPQTLPHEIQKTTPVPKKVIEEQPIEKEQKVVKKKSDRTSIVPHVEKTTEKLKPALKPKKRVKRSVRKREKKNVQKKVFRKIQKRYIKKTAKRKQLASVKKQHYSPAKKNYFLTQIRRRIDAHKCYPRIAQKRGMRGSIKVRFTILPNGHVANIRVFGPKVFLKSAREAVRAAFPVNVKPAPMKLPETVNLTLRYQLH